LSRTCKLVCLGYGTYRESNLCPRDERFCIQGAEPGDSTPCPVDESLCVQSVEPGESNMCPLSMR
jgi:hypothetical protein